MEFLLITKNFAGGLYAGESFAEGAIETEHPTKVYEYGDVLLARRCDETLHPEGVLFDGALFGDELYHPRYSVPTPNKATEMVGRISSLSGVFVLGGIGAAGAILHTDVLGQYRLYYLTHGRDFAVSNSARIINLLQCSPPSPQHLANSLVYLSEFASHGPSDETKTLPPRHHIVINCEGLHVRETVTRTQLYRPQVSYAERLKECADEMRRNARLIAEFRHRHDAYCTVDLSGGIDSRMTAAAFIGAGCADQVRFCNVDNSRDPEVASADRLASEKIIDTFNLPTGAGLGSSAYDTATLNSEMTFSPSSKFGYGVNHYYAAIPSAFADYGELILPGYMRVGGYCGEHTRAPGANFGTVLNGTPHDITETFMRFLTREAPDLTWQLVTKDALEGLRAGASQYFADVMSELPAKLVNTVTYVENRSRCHFGMRSQNANKSSVSLSPLTTPLALGLHQHLEYGQIFHGKISYDLIVEMSGKKLAHLPMAGDFWRPAVTDDPDYDRAPAKAGPHVTRHSVDPVTIPKKGKAITPIADWLKRTGKPDNQRSVLEYALTFPESPDWEALDRAAIQRLAASQDGPQALGQGGVRLCSMLLMGFGNRLINRLEKRYDVLGLIEEANDRAQRAAA